MNTVIEYANILSSLPLFENTDSSVLVQWLTKHVQTPVEIKSGMDVDAGDQRRLGILLQGQLEIHSADNEKNVILRTLNAPAIFGAASLFCEGAAPFSHIVAKSGCTLLLISLEAVRALLAQDEGFRDAYLTFLSDRVRFLNRKIQCFTAGSAERKLALWLISEDQKSIVLPTALSSLAEMLDLGRASLYRALDKLESEGLISRSGRTITVISQEKILQKYQ
jgi:CRP-like cAMP-binding protein